MILVIPTLSVEGSSSLQDPLPHLVSTWRLFEHTLGYPAVIGFFTRTPSRTAGVDGPGTDLRGCGAGRPGVAVVARVLAGQAVRPAKAAVFFLLVFVVMTVEVSATRQAIYPYHVIELMPYPVLIVLCSLVAVIRSGTSFRAPSAIIAAAGLGLTLAVQGFSTTQFASLMQNPDRLVNHWSTGVYQDAAFINANIGHVDEVVSAGWGPGAPLFSLACPADRPKYRDDLYTTLTNLPQKKSTVGVIRHLFGNQRIFLVFNPNPAETQSSANIEANEWFVYEAYIGAFPNTPPRSGAEDSRRRCHVLRTPTFPCYARDLLNPFCKLITRFVFCLSVGMDVVAEGKCRVRRGGTVAPPCSHRRVDR